MRRPANPPNRRKITSYISHTKLSTKIEQKVETGSLLTLVMPYRKQQFVNGEIYHLVLKAIDNNLLFKDIDDYFRGIFSVYEFNTDKLVEIRERRRIRLQIKKACGDPVSANCGHRVSAAGSVVDERDKLVEVLVFSLMPNHIHLLVRQIKDNGVTKFMNKLGAGLGRYLNIKYGRKGHVFQDRFLAVLIKTNEQLEHIFTYIHTNAISLIEPNWKEEGIKDPEKIINFLEQKHRWSSYFDYIGKKNFPSVTDRDFMLKVMGGEQGCRAAINYWIKYKKTIREIPNIDLE